jgi:mono/diheme cytochrome c family protein
MRINMRQILFMCFSLSITALCTDNYAQSTSPAWGIPVFADTLTNPLNATDDNLKQGGKLYLNTCAACHGYSGKGNGPAASALNPKPADHTSEKVQNESDGAIFYKISTGRGPMQPYNGTLSAKQRWQLVLYIRSLTSTTGNVGATAK